MVRAAGGVDVGDVVGVEWPFVAVLRGGGGL
jgi:hypothetical protein